jgi:GTPase SAR1 family protein
MFSLVNGVYDAYFSPPKLNLLVVGAQSVGKTAVLERCKVTSFNRSKKAAAINLQQSEKLPIYVFLGKDAAAAAAADNSASAAAASIDIVESPVLPQKKPGLSRWFICPAPQKYAVAGVDDDDEEDYEQEIVEPLTTPAGGLISAAAAAAPPIPGTETMASQNRTSSMESVELQDSASPASPAPAKASQTPTADFDLRLNTKMLPLRKIRPTIGMNLAKNLDICGAKCNVWDLGGRLEGVWERYYHDCDAVVFVWKLDTGADESDKNGGADDDSDSDDERPELTPEMQLRLLEKVRSSIPDDIPFLVLGHLHSPSLPPQCRPDTLYSTAQLLPHYHNPCQALYFCNAGTGQGVRSAMEWLIPLAKRQQAIRDRSAVNDAVDKK